MNKINKIAVLGAGTMGSAIACHFANKGFQVLLLDLLNTELSEEEKARGLSNESKAVRNKIVHMALEACVKSKPSPLYDMDYKKRIKTGNFEDNIQQLKECDWIIEAVSERIEVKKSLYEKVEKNRKKASLITSNTSGIPIHVLAEGRSEDFKKHFCGTHFFNPPRYLELLEIIPTKHTSPSVVKFLEDVGTHILGKECVVCKDTPGFVGNLIGVYSLFSIMRAKEKFSFDVSQIDALTGLIIGRAKSGTFRTLDVVGIDIVYNMKQNFLSMLSKEETNRMFEGSEMIDKLYEKKWLGNKTKQGFYKVEKDEHGQKTICQIDFNDLSYSPAKREKKEKSGMAKGMKHLKKAAIGLFDDSYKVIEQAKEAIRTEERIKLLFNSRGKVGDFYRYIFCDVFSYCSEKIPELINDFTDIDRAICAGFGWEIGPFQLWDILGVKDVTKTMKKQHFAVANWVAEMLDNGVQSFYTLQDTDVYTYVQHEKKNVLNKREAGIVRLKKYESQKVWSKKDSSLYDIGDGVLNFKMETKMNTIGEEVLYSILEAIQHAEDNHYKGVVLGNGGMLFSAGADLNMLLQGAVEKKYDKIDATIRLFHKVSMKLKYAHVPTVCALSGLALGGGCEFALHCSKRQVYPETYIGLVELGAGLIPAGGGTKEMVIKAATSYKKDDVEFNTLLDYFSNIAMAKVSTSAKEALKLYYVNDDDPCTINAKYLLTDAKNTVLALSKNYVQPLEKNSVKVHGRGGLAYLHMVITNMLHGNYISSYDAFLAKKLAYVMCGGDLSGESFVTEDYLLDLEREVFLSLCGEKKTQERIEHIIKKGKPLRN